MDGRPETAAPPVAGAGAPKPGETGEADLVERLRRGDEGAYGELVRAEGGRMLQVARRFVGEEEARDVVQEAFLSAFRSIHRFDRRSRLGTWLHRIVVNAALMRLRKKSAQVEESLEPLLPTFRPDGHRAGVGPRWPKDPAQIFDRRELRRIVRGSIDRLPPNYRSVVLLRDIEGLSGAETGELLGITPGAVKVRLHRARQALREFLAPELTKEEAS